MKYKCIDIQEMNEKRFEISCQSVVEDSLFVLRNHVSLASDLQETRACRRRGNSIVVTESCSKILWEESYHRRLDCILQSQLFIILCLLLQEERNVNVT